MRGQTRNAAQANACLACLKLVGDDECCLVVVRKARRVIAIAGGLQVAVTEQANI